MTAFRAAARRDFEKRAIGHLMEKYPEYAQSQGEDGLRQLLRESEIRAKAVDLGAESGIVTWAELSIRFGPQFYIQETWANSIVRARSVDAGERIRRLREHL
jgi:hypothetical protein